jgi:hypothetical protein
MDALYEKAKLEKTLVLYGAGPTGSHDRWIKDFEPRFPGVTVALTGGLSNGLNQKIEQQLAAKRMETDLAIFQTIQDFGKWKKAGALLLFKPEGSDTQGRGRRLHRGQRQHRRLCLQHHAPACGRGAEIRARFSSAPVSGPAHHHRSDRR